MENSKYLLVESCVLPEVFLKVCEAKSLLAKGIVKNASEAAKAVMVEQKLDAIMDQRGVFVGGLDITDMVINKLKTSK